ncbi:hypothetical protein [Bradyrhizobium sp. UFLA05-112]
MRTASVAALLWLALSSLAMAQGGGYPASPSHAVVGASPDGTPRYGREPRKEEGASSDTVGRGGDSNSERDRALDASNSDDGNERRNGHSQKREK